MKRFDDLVGAGAILVMDGGLATQLEAGGHDISSHLWSAALLRSDPDAVVQAHLEFLDAGADCIISASYQASQAGFMELGLTAFEADRLIAGSVELACKARDRFMEHATDGRLTPLVAASVGPWGATRHDGSEFRGDYGVPASVLKEFHYHRLPVLDDAGADLLACETIPDHTEAQVLHELLRLVKTPAWISFTCRDERHLRDGTPLRDMAALFADHPRVVAVGVNCTAPRLIPALIAECRAGAPDKAVVVYPNSGEAWNQGRQAWSEDAEVMDWGAAARSWQAAGARMLGGCCRVSPAQIAAVRAALDHEEKERR